MEGVTGVRDNLPERIKDDLRLLRSESDVLVVVGFGISRPEHVASLAGHCEAVVVGSALLDAISTGGDDPAATAERFVRGLGGAETLR